MHPRLAVVAYPTFSETDRAVIQGIRAQYDPQFALVDPHVTLLFPLEASLADVVNETRAAARGIARFSIRLRSVNAVRDAEAGGGRVFLIPGEGAREIALLNSRLYAGAFRWAYRADLHFVPHITVAARPEFVDCEVLAATLAREHRDLDGAIKSLTVVQIASARVGEMACLPLGRPG
jgi:2'-5' RNA ligase